MTDMLSRAWFEGEDDMVLEDEEVGVEFFESTQMSANIRSTPALNEFDENNYKGEWLQIGRLVNMMALNAS